MMICLRVSMKRVLPYTDIMNHLQYFSFGWYILVIAYFMEFLHGTLIMLSLVIEEKMSLPYSYFQKTTY